MTPRVFISYRTSDGADKATALARELGARPVLLVLVTPQYLDALDAQGRRRIESPDDSVRTSSRRRLRAYDWKQDVARLAADLRALGAAGRGRTAGAAAAHRRVRPRRPGAAGRGGGGWWWWQAQRNATRLSGTWTAMIAPRGAPTVRNAEPLQFRIKHDGDRLRLTSVPAEIDRDPAWAEYRTVWSERTGQDLRRVVYRDEGTVRFDSGGAGSIDVAVRIETQKGKGPIDGGNLQAAVGEAGRRMTGRALAEQRASRARGRTAARTWSFSAPSSHRGSRRWCSSPRPTAASKDLVALACISAML